MNILRNFFLLLALTAGPAYLIAQSSTCIESDPFCTGVNYVFPASVNAPDAEDGPDYGCLGSQPNPVWYHMMIDDPGDIIIDMYSTPSNDIDFICWGPFDDPHDPCVDDLTEDKIVDCSYSVASVEECVLSDVETGEYYILMITNYSNDPCNITFSQTGGDATTDCSIVPPQASSNSPVCEGEPLELYAADMEDATYSWSGPDGFSSEEQNPVITDAGEENSGIYEVYIEVGGIQSDPSTTEVIVAPQPGVDAGEDQTIPYGTYTQLSGSLDQDPADYTISWQPDDLLDDPTILDPQTVNLNSTTDYSLMATHSEYGCSATDVMTVIVEGDPLSVTINAEEAICYGEETTLEAVVAGGAGDYTYYWTSDPAGFESTLPAPTVSPAVSTIYTVEVSDGYNSTSAQTTLVVDPLPEPDAGPDQSIPYGTSTQLAGSVAGNQSEHMAVWTPEEFLENPDEWETNTTQLETSQQYELTVEETATECVAADQTTVTVTGGPLQATISASQDYACLGESVQLQAVGSGGSGDYSYAWTSVPAGFSSDIPNPLVSPQQNTTYHLMVDDGFNTAEDEVFISVKENPELSVMPDTSVVYGTVLTLHAQATGGNVPYGFSWSPEELLEQNNVQNPTTIELFSNVTFGVQVNDNLGCVSDEKEIHVNIETNTLSTFYSPVSPELCYGDSATLTGGYSGNIGDVEAYWSDATGQVISLENACVVQPDSTTDFYFVAQDDYFSDSVMCRVVVHQNPEIEIVPEGYSVEEGNVVNICVHDTVDLFVEQNQYTLQWSNGSTADLVTISSSGISADMQFYSIVAENEYGCRSSDSLYAYFSYNSCVGLEEHEVCPLMVYPNPAKAMFYVEHPEKVKLTNLKLFNSEGDIVISKRVTSDKPMLNVKGLSNGAYMLKAESAEGSFTTMVLIHN